MADREHAAVEAVQSSRFDAPRDRTAPEAERHELLPRDDAVLLRGERRHAPVQFAPVEFCIHVVQEAPGPMRSPPEARLLSSSASV